MHELRLLDIQKKYKDKEAVRKFNYTFTNGVYGLLGENGAGKTTLMRLICGVLQPTGGSIYCDNIEIVSMGAEYRKLLGYLPQDFGYYGDFTAERFLRYMAALKALPEDYANSRIDELLDMVELKNVKKKKLKTYSGGMIRRIGIAQALLNNPEILILDEPTSFLDVRYKLEFLTILKDLVREKQIAVILSLHELDLAQRISDVVLCIRNHTVDRIGTPDEIFTDAYITNLYGITCGSYESLYGTMELPAPTGTPQTFVIGGGGTGNAVYRQLQRENIPFYAGVLQENDLDYPVAKALATEVVAEKAFEPIGESAFQKASSLLQHCEQVILCCKQFGAMNQKNQELVSLAKENGKQILEANS